ncbi:MAG: MFS transporter [Planctomycetota bacterium]|jgi:nucleoside transporter
MELKLHIALSFAMFMEYAIWGAWFPVLAARLFGPLKMTGKQVGLIYATLPLACIVFPLAGGWLADKHVNTEWILVLAHLAGAALMFLAARKTTFKSLFAVLLLYSMFFAATLPLVNSLMFHHLGKVYTNAEEIGRASGKIFLWAPIAWALAGYFLTGWRWKFKTGEQGRDCLYFAAVLSLIMAVGCLFMPKTPPAVATADAVQTPIWDTLKMLDQTHFLVFVLVSMIIAGLMQFYFQGTAQFMQDVGIPSKNVPASMAIAQAAQAIGTFFLMSVLLEHLGYKWTLVIGAGCWLLLYVIYIGTKERILLIPAQSLHGLAYVFFIIVGQKYANSIAAPQIVSTMQALMFAATTGLGMLLGTQLAGAIMDNFKSEEKFQWRQIFAVPAAIALVCILVFILLFNPSAAQAG